MPRIELQSLSDESRVWIFGISPSLNESQTARLTSAVDAFLAGWAAHGQPIRAARDVIEGTFLVVAVDKESGTTGCSIDRMFGTLRDLERELGVSILDSSRVFLRHGDGRAEGLSRAQFRDKADQHTIVFETNVETLGEVRSGAWEKPAHESWHRELVRRAV